MLRQLLALLADGQFHSGDELGQALGVSRAAVWKQLKKLEDLDIPCSSVKGKGYRLQDAIELLDEDEIQGCLSYPLDRMDVLLDTASTNTYLFSQASEHMGKRYVALAEKQTGGRGRRGRTWVSPFGKNIYMSLLVTMPGQIAALEGFSLLVAIAVERALVQLGIDKVGLKWPNDVYLDGRKLAGILLESSQSQPNYCQVVIGVGLNLSLSDSDAEKIEQPWAALRQYCPDLSRNQVAGVLLNQLLWAVNEFQRDGFAPWISYWAERDIFYRREVALTSVNDRKQGVVKGVNRKGELLLQTERGIDVVVAGELSVRSVD